MEAFTGVGITGGYGNTVPLAALEGSFNGSVDSVSAVMQPFGRCFRAEGERVRFTGSRSGGGAVEMQSQAVDGQVVRINATLSAAGDTLQGTYSITGGCGAGAAGAVIGRRVDLTGVWTGTMGMIPTVFDLQMASTPDADANYVLSGSATFSNTQCFRNAVIIRRARGRVLFPDVVGDTQRLELIAEVSEDLSTMHIVFALVAGTCPELSFGDGRLVRQDGSASACRQSREKHDHQPRDDQRREAIAVQRGNVFGEDGAHQARTGPIRPSSTSRWPPLTETLRALLGERQDRRRQGEIKRRPRGGRTNRMSALVR